MRRQHERRRNVFLYAVNCVAGDDINAQNASELNVRFCYGISFVTWTRHRCSENFLVANGSGINDALRLHRHLRASGHGGTPRCDRTAEANVVAFAPLCRKRYLRDSTRSKPV
jgi:hypothetical protein